MPLFLNLLLLKQESAYSSLVDIMTLTTLAEVSYDFVQCKWEVECKTVVCGHWKSQMNGVIIA